MSISDINIFWFRRDLRLEDNCGLFHILKENDNVLPIFIFDKTILELLPSDKDRRVDYIFYHVLKIKKSLEDMGASMKIIYNTPLEAFKELTTTFPKLKAVYCNHDYEPEAIHRDNDVKRFLQDKNIVFKTYKDQVIFERNEILKDDGTPYIVFTPYSKRWKERYKHSPAKPFLTKTYFNHFLKTPPYLEPTLADLGFKKTATEKSFFSIDGFAPTYAIVKSYNKTRNYLYLDNGTTQLSVHLRFGTISIRQLVIKIRDMNETYLNELIWREFYQMILWNFPHVVKSAFKLGYDLIPWENNESHFDKWCKGETGIPIVDAAMKQLNQTGYMHNRARMLVASFLTKNLFIDWRWGEKYFADNLNDFELASNNGGWQWSASTGCDAAPYFRIFNPMSQQEKFDPDYVYVKKWIPDFNLANYQKPIVDLKSSRQKAIETFSKVIKRDG